ncbi:PELOTA 1-like protein, partial [Tanacetum coccineum]
MVILGLGRWQWFYGFDGNMVEVKSGGSGGSCGGRDEICVLCIIPNESDDLWLAYNLIVPGDTVMAVTI